VWELLSDPPTVPVIELNSRCIRLDNTKPHCSMTASDYFSFTLRELTRLTLSGVTRNVGALWMYRRLTSLLGLLPACSSLAKSPRIGAIIVGRGFYGLNESPCFAQKFVYTVAALNRPGNDVLETAFLPRLRVHGTNIRGRRPA
jgi:hypothetical protein